jgi:hypothetical protein
MIRDQRASHNQRNYHDSEFHIPPTRNYLSSVKRFRREDNGTNVPFSMRDSPRQTRNLTPEGKSALES